MADGDYERRGGREAELKRIQRRMADIRQRVNTDNLFLFVVWESVWREGRGDEVCAEIRRRFKPFREYDVALPQEDWEANLARFYGMENPDIWHLKKERNGSGVFRVMLVVDEHPAWEPGKDMHGRPDTVNRNIVEAKSALRHLCKAKHSIHSSISPRETRRNFFMLFGRPLSEEAALPPTDHPPFVRTRGPTGRAWADRRAFLEGLAECTSFTPPPPCGSEGERGLVVENLAEFAAVSGAVKLSSRATDNRWCIPMGDGFEVWRVGEGTLKTRTWEVRDFLDVRLTRKRLSLYILPRVGLASIFRLQLRLGGLFHIDLALGTLKV